jgi:hypothetical protein
MNKTGTSAIQHFFSQQREALKEQGLLYPATGCNREAHYLLSEALGFIHKKQQSSGEMHERELALLRKALDDEINKSVARQVLFSSENFVIPRTLEPVRQLFSDYDTRIIVYLRRHNEWRESAYNQAVKMVAKPPWEQGFESYVNFRKRKTPKHGCYRELVDRWAKVSGKENIIVRPYERQQNKPNIVNDIYRLW